MTRSDKKTALVMLCVTNNVVTTCSCEMRLSSTATLIPR